VGVGPTSHDKVSLRSPSREFAKSVQTQLASTCDRVC